MKHIEGEVEIDFFRTRISGILYEHFRFGNEPIFTREQFCVNRVMERFDLGLSRGMSIHQEKKSEEQYGRNKDFH